MLETLVDVFTLVSEEDVLVAAGFRGNVDV